MKIFVINPGSTSTKIGLFEDAKPVFETTVKHHSEEIERFSCPGDQKDMRLQAILKALADNGIDGSEIDCISARGGFLRPMESGTYEVNEKMLRDLRSPAASAHAAALGALIGADLAKEWGCKAYIVDPVVVDEMEPVAKLSGLAGIERRSIFHALNTKSILRKAAAKLGKRYEDCRFIAVHMGGGVTVSAHRYGRVIDVNDAMGGDGAFTPDRTGGLPMYAVVEMCFSGNYTKQEMLDIMQCKGGLYSYLGTNSMQEAEKMIVQGDEFAALVIDAMAYQICKEIGAMFAVLEGRVDGIVLTGGIARSVRFTALIKKRVDMLAPVWTYEGENEMEALAEGVLRVKNGKDFLRVY